MSLWRTGIDARRNARWRVGQPKVREPGGPATTFLDQLRTQMAAFSKSRGSTPAAGKFDTPQLRGWRKGKPIPKTTFEDLVTVRNAWLKTYLGNMLGRTGFFDDDLRDRIERNMERFSVANNFLLAHQKIARWQNKPQLLTILYPYNEQYWSALRNFALFMDSFIFVKTPEKRIFEAIVESVKELPGRVADVLPSFPWRYLVYGVIGIGAMWGISTWQDVRLRKEIQAGRMDRARRGLL